MRVGSLVFATDQGLGYLAKNFYDHGIVTDVMVVRHGRRHEHAEWFPNAQRITDLYSQEQYADMRAFCAKMDIMLFFETPFRWELLDWCKECKTKTVLVPMHECMPRTLPAFPDFMLCPSLLDLRYAQVSLLFGHVNSKFLPIPVEVPWRKRTRAEVFVHNAGNGGLRGRNGTKELMHAMPFVKSPIKLILRSQEGRYVTDDPRVEHRVGCAPFDALWEEGDCFIFPEKFNGLSLPLQEARAAGMLVMATDRFPMNTWLPREPLISVSDVRRASVGGNCIEFDEAIIEPRDIAAKIDEWHGKDISEYSEAGGAWAEDNSWTVLGPKYQELLRSL